MKKYIVTIDPIARAKYLIAAVDVFSFELLRQTAEDTFEFDILCGGGRPCLRWPRGLRHILYSSPYRTPNTFYIQTSNHPAHGVGEDRPESTRARGAHSEHEFWPVSFSIFFFMEKSPSGKSFADLSSALVKANKLKELSDARDETGLNGLTRIAVLPAPRYYYNPFRPNQGRPFAEYRASVYANNYYPVYNISLMIYCGVKSVQPVDMVPVPQYPNPGIQPRS